MMFRNRQIVKYLGALKQVNHGIPYIYHAKYMKKHGLSQFTMYCHGAMVYYVIPCKITKHHGIPCNSMAYYVIPWYVFIRELTRLSPYFTTLYNTEFIPAVDQLSDIL